MKIIKLKTKLIPYSFLTVILLMLNSCGSTNGINYRDGIYEDDIISATPVPETNITPKRLATEELASTPNTSNGFTSELNRLNKSEETKNNIDASINNTFSEEANQNYTNRTYRDRQNDNIVINNYSSPNWRLRNQEAEFYYGGWYGNNNWNWNYNNNYWNNRRFNNWNNDYWFGSNNWYGGIRSNWYGCYNDYYNPYWGVNSFGNWGNIHIRRSYYGHNRNWNNRWNRYDRRRNYRDNNRYTRPTRRSRRSDNRYNNTERASSSKNNNRYERPVRRRSRGTDSNYNNTKRAGSSNNNNNNRYERPVRKRSRTSKSYNSSNTRTNKSYKRSNTNKTRTTKSSTPRTRRRRGSRR